ncbi:Uncharacterised protein [Mycobacteroides abscessus subsp. abscessus]|nr:Uncharacterised protein [Mycobacteroides abscessus subsp. abscessus]
MGDRAAGHVDVVDQLVVHQVSADIGAAGQNSHRADFNEWLQDLGEHGQQGIGDGIELERHHAVVGEQLVQGVQRRDRRDVSGTKHRADTVRVAGVALRQTRGAQCLGLVHAGLQPEFGAEPGQQQAVEDVERQYRDRGAAPGGDTELGIAQRAVAGLELLQAGDESGDGARDGVGARDPFLADQRRLRVELFDVERCRLHPLRGVVDHALACVRQQPQSIRQRCFSPSFLAVCQILQCLVDGGFDLYVGHEFQLALW